ncbi:DUF1641 domain-containing protein [Mycolicibacterium brisbanense]|uniref:DUF1641 domain-containing protein n=1 Tax=Mycolicibacterium brisbanense TaxID=146020 RepID=A0A124E0J0_9MYCO|nr:DUF1641 domain-containing protein [Mycolicibacterium brisbanense]MCV7156502.1 DUF1641 domain-containing protein [Mycolicibacterium brisbanense]GAS90678.1 uncharacterized protein RMCB_4774 [Mycolicibacterium brisbanense]
MAAHASLIESRESEDLIADSPGDAIIARLDDPQIAASLSLILDHADLIATMIVGLDGLVRRAEVIGDNVASGLAEVRDLAASSAGTARWPAVDLAALSETVARLSAAVVDAAPALDKLLRSPLTDPQTADVLANAGEALLEGKQAAAADPRGPRGVFALMRVTKDPDVSRGLGFMIHIARAFGRRLAPEGSSNI